MRLALEVQGTRPGGPRTYAVELLRHLLDQRGALSVIALTYRTPHRPGPLPPDLYGHPRLSVVETVGTIHTVPWWQQVRLPALLAAVRADLFHATKGLLPWRLPCPAIVTIHDLAPLVAPETFTARQRAYWHLLARRSTARARRIVVDSQTARRALLKWRPLLAAKVVTAPLGAACDEPQATTAAAAQGAAFRARHRLSEHLVGWLGTIQPRKGLAEIIRGFLAVRPRLSEPWELAVGGGRGWRWRDALDGLNPERPPPGVRFLGEVAEAEKAAFYRALSLLVVAGRDEGFGLSALEAAAYGVPVLAPAREPFREVFGAAAVYFGTAAPTLTDRLFELLSDAALRRGPGRRGAARAAVFSWHRTAECLLSVYRSVCAESVPRP